MKLVDLNIKLYKTLKTEFISDNIDGSGGRRRGGTAMAARESSEKGRSRRERTSCNEPKGQCCKITQRRGIDYGRNT